MWCSALKIKNLSILRSAIGNWNALLYIFRVLLWLQKLWRVTSVGLHPTLFPMLMAHTWQRRWRNLIQRQLSLSLPQRYTQCISEAKPFFLHFACYSYSTLLYSFKISNREQYIQFNGHMPFSSIKRQIIIFQLKSQHVSLNHLTPYTLNTHLWALVWCGIWINHTLPLTMCKLWQPEATASSSCIAQSLLH